MEFTGMPLAREIELRGNPFEITEPQRLCKRKRLRLRGIPCRLDQIGPGDAPGKAERLPRHDRRDENRRYGEEQRDPDRDGLKYRSQTPTWNPEFHVGSPPFT
ncbi:MULTISPECIES: hypothetical protein [Salipiger]|uniref:hypothetical protein n=1 Tax=Salipiger TaxID=263377 RepID=UPI0012FFC4D1|nr:MULTISPECIES: hypothetical protein [Salipiger]GFZ95867.1 hypothetical protein GCM10011326_03720 [Salipiger profundus]